VSLFCCELLLPMPVVVTRCAFVTYRVLYLNNNQLSGSIPSSLRNLTSLRLVRCSRSPAFLEAVNLFRWGVLATRAVATCRMLYLDNNQLSGSIPSLLGSLTALQ
jgi:hypothetical protein